MEYQDIPACPTDYMQWNQTELIEQCTAERTHCGKREIRIATIGKHYDANETSTEFPILHPPTPDHGNVFVSYYSVYGCTNPVEECGNNEDMLLIPEFNATVDSEEYTFHMSFTEATNCKQCNQWLCNAEDLGKEDEKHNSSSRNLVSGLLLVFSSVLFFKMA